MRKSHLVLPVLLLTAITGCGSSSETLSSPSPVPQGTSSEPPAAPGPCAVGFADVRANGAPFASYAECGLTITAALADWQAVTTYGSPAPFIQFKTPGGTTTTGEITAVAAGAAFSFVSVDIYSSTTKIPYEITGLANRSVVFTLQDVQGNTFGAFATIANPHAAAVIDTLRIRLTNPAAPCCANPVGLDNIRVVR